MLPEWKDKKVPEIAKYYWKMGKASHSHHRSLCHDMMQRRGISAEAFCRIVSVSQDNPGRTPHVLITAC